MSRYNSEINYRVIINKLKLWAIVAREQTKRVLEVNLRFSFHSSLEVDFFTLFRLLKNLKEVLPILLKSTVSPSSTMVTLVLRDGLVLSSRIFTGKIYFTQINNSLLGQ
jgi:hypothetical protein